MERGRIEYLDGWRGLSVLLVLAGHFIHIPGIGAGGFGVECFFVLSGRLMAEILFVREFPLGAFYQRRLSRIYPALLVFVAISVLVLGADGVSAVRALTFTLNYLGTSNNNLDHVWSLCVEEHAYLLLGALAWLARRRRINVPAVLWTLTGLSMLDGAFRSAVLHQDWYHAYWPTDAHVGSIFGSAALYLSLRGRRIDCWWAPLAFATLGVALNADVVPDAAKYTLGTLSMAAALNLLPDGAAAFRRALSWRPVVTMGVLSYSVYLWQQPLYQLSFGHHKAYGLGLLVVAIGLGAISYHLVEQPARGALNRLFARPRLVPAPAE
jgi:peptidoglycan/LPS O-acetylase OafA/YrhL